jgi:gluconate 5-dehydrogenase
MEFPGFSLEGKVMLVTGSARGIGRGIAMAASKMGADVIVHATNRPALEKVVKEIRTQGGNAELVVFDLGKMDEIARGVQESIDIWGRVDVLVNNAGVARRKAALEMTEEDWDFTFDVNLKGLFFLTQAIAKPMIERKKGKIINIASTMGLVGGPTRTVYGASKGGVVTLTKGLAIEWGQHNVTVNTVAPAVTRTEMSAPMLEDKAFHEYIVKNIPMGRVGEIFDIAGAVLFLASEAANWVTGQTIAVDGGWLAW